MNHQKLLSDATLPARMAAGESGVDVTPELPIGVPLTVLSSCTARCGWNGKAKSRSATGNSGVFIGFVCFPGVTTHCGCIFTVLASSFSRSLDHTQRRATVGRTPLDEWSIRRRDLYLTTHNTHYRQTSMPPVRFEPTIAAGERPKTYALDRAATGTIYRV